MTLKEVLKERQSNRLRHVMKKEGLKQKDLCEILNLSQQMISAIACGRARLSEDQAEILSSKYGYDPEWLLGHNCYGVCPDCGKSILKMMQCR